MYEPKGSQTIDQRIVEAATRNTEIARLKAQLIRFLQVSEGRIWQSEDSALVEDQIEKFRRLVNGGKS